MRPQRSRMAYFGSNALNNSTSVEDPENYMIPTYSAFNGRGGGSNLLRDFHYQINSLRNSRGAKRQADVFSPRSAVQKSRHKRVATQEIKLPETESVFSQPDILDNVETITPKLFQQPKKQLVQRSKYRNQRVDRELERDRDIQRERELDRQRDRQQYSLPAVSQNNSHTKSDSMTNDRILLELMNIKDRMSLNEQMRMQQPYMYQQPQPVQQRSSALEDKMLQMLMKMSLNPQQPQQPQQQPIIIQQPQQPQNYYPPPQQPPKYPYSQYTPPPPPRRQEYSPQPPRNEPRYTPPPPQYAPPPRQEYPQYHPPAPKKNMKYVRRRLRKVFWAVAFPFLLKKYSSKLILVRKQYMINNLASILIESNELIKQWFFKSSSKAISMLQNTMSTNLQFHQEQDQNLCDDKMKKLANVIDMIMNSLEDTSKIEITREFLPFISVTCDNRSFIHQNFITNKELQYIQFSEEHKYQFLDQNLQLVQIILFIFIKVIIYDILFQPQRIEESWSKQPLETNLKLIGYIIYYCTEQLLNQKLKNVKPKGYVSIKQEGKNSEVEKKKVEDNLTWDRLTYLDGVKGKEYVEKIKKYRNGDFWKNWKRQIMKIGNKLHNEMTLKRRIVDKVFKQLEVKFQRKEMTVEHEEEEEDD